MNNPKYICALSAIIAVVSLLVLASFVYPSEASYTQSPEIWYWTALINTTYVVHAGVWAYTVDAGADENQYLNGDTSGTILIPVFATNPNPTLVMKVTKAADGAFALLSNDGKSGKKQFGNVSMFYPTTALNETIRVSTNLSNGYSTLNVTVKPNSTQNLIRLQAMWLE